MRVPFNATCGDVASWSNDQTDGKQAFAKCINVSNLNHLGGVKKFWGHCPRMTPRGYGPGLPKPLRYIFVYSTFRV